MYLCVTYELLILLGLLLAALLVIWLVSAVIEALTRPSAHKKRLMQIQIDKKQAQKELAKLTQDYLQRMKR
jgi:hypothetical protein